MLLKYHSTEFNELLNYLYGLRRLGIKAGLRHTLELLKYCGSPETKFRSVHIAGTNGKGSTAVILASILQNTGLKVGLYTSPHLICFNERVRINGDPVSDDWIADFIKKHQADIDTLQATFFETTTALAFSYFAEQGVDVAIIETGLGGRLDSTNVLTPEVTAITPVSLDHRELLGDDLIAIAEEKAGIIKPGIPLVLAPQEMEVIAVLERTAAKKSVPVIKIEMTHFEEISVSVKATAFVFKDNQFELPLLGDHQAVNAGVAMQIARLIIPTISVPTIQKGLKKVNWPGRLQQLCSVPMVFYDVAHNAHGLKIVMQTIRCLCGIDPVILFVLKGDKELGLIAAELDQCSGPLIISGAEDSGLLSSKALGSKLSAILNREFLEIADFNQAMEVLVNRTSELGAYGLITGSHYVAEDIFRRFEFSFQNGRI
ncbi:MAG: bifunctional folylpolyglutamate synthase/dihydrofolate synthase [Fidelibacterota bacterium]